MPWYDNDPEIKAGMQRYNELQFIKEQAQMEIKATLLPNHVLYGSYDQNPERSGLIANAEAEQANLEASYNRRLAQAQQQSAPAHLTGAERDALPPEKMSFADGVEIAQRGTRWEGKIGLNDPDVYRGYLRLQEKKAHGE